MLIRKRLSLFFLLIVSIYAQSQITIGSDEQPVSGSLLQLKENESTADNSSKGLLLPRVELTRIQGLRPMLGNWDGDAYEWNRHIGLTVYNVNNCLQKGWGHGVYSWDGIQWQFVGKKEDQSKYYIYIDQDGNPFTAAPFGQAGIWMTQNVKATKYANGNDVDPQGLSPTKELDTENPRWAYPGYKYETPPGYVDGTDPSDFNIDPAVGILYNWLAATGGTNIPTDPNSLMRDQTQRDRNIYPQPHEAEVESVFETPAGSGNKNGKVQGICPDGWHLPSDREWNELEREIYENPGRYSDFTSEELAKFSSEAWNTDWEWGRSGDDVFPAELKNNLSVRYRGPNINKNGTEAGDPHTTKDGVYGHGATLKAPCPPPAGWIVNNNTQGKSKSYLFGGFNALLAGNRFKAANEGLQKPGFDSFGYEVYYWTSSANMYGESKQAIYRLLHSYGASVNRDTGPRENFYSVRCKKDTSRP